MRGNSPAHSREKPTAAELPDLGQLAIEPDRSQPKAALVYKLLRQAAMECRSMRCLPFYPVRGVAAQFGISPATVSRIYQRLHSERLLRLVWGSKTMVEPIESVEPSQPHTIGIPVAVTRFTNEPDYRDAILGLQRDMWSYRISEHLLFFQQRDEEVLSSFRRYHSALDVVLWVFPDMSNIPTALRLHNLGIRVACIGGSAIPGIRENYVVSAGSTIHKIFREKILKI
jgi:hypothetical protein